MSDSLITYELDGAVALIGLNRPDKRNAINEELVTQLRNAVNRAGEEAFCGLLFGHGDNFSSGLDLREALTRAASQAGPPKKRRRHSWHEVFDIIARGPIPFVAALHGAVVGGGLELATAAHVRVGDSTTFFGLPEGQRGIFVGGGGTVRIQRVIGYTVMADLMLTGRLLTAEEGLREHIITYLMPKGEALAKAREIAAKIAQNVPDTNWRITNLLPRANDLSHEDGLFLEYMSSNMARSPETAARLQHFVDGNAKLVKPESKS
jgi:enoyl-CoA hydratase/carnithine racemase